MSKDAPPRQPHIETPIKVVPKEMTSRFFRNDMSPFERNDVAMTSLMWNEQQRPDYIDTSQIDIHLTIMRSGSGGREASRKYARETASRLADVVNGYHNFILTGNDTSLAAVLRKIGVGVKHVELTTNCVEPERVFLAGGYSRVTRVKMAVKAWCRMWLRKVIYLCRRVEEKIDG